MIYLVNCICVPENGVSLFVPIIKDSFAVTGFVLIHWEELWSVLFCIMGKFFVSHPESLHYKVLYREEVSKKWWLLIEPMHWFLVGPHYCNNNQWMSLTNRPCNQPKIYSFGNFLGVQKCLHKRGSKLVFSFPEPKKWGGKGYRRGFSVFALIWYVCVMKSLFCKFSFQVIRTGCIQHVQFKIVHLN